MTPIPAEWSQHAVYLVSERAYLLHTEGRFKESLVLFEGLHAMYPENLYYNDAVSALYLALKRPEEAIRFASNAIALAPDYVNGFMRRCEAYLMMEMRSESWEELKQLQRLRAYGVASRMEMRLNAVGDMPASRAEP
jgi:predicted Zn-dependent protease